MLEYCLKLVEKFARIYRNRNYTPRTEVTTCTYYGRRRNMRVWFLRMWFLSPRQSNSHLPKWVFRVTHTTSDWHTFHDEILFPVEFWKFSEICRQSVKPNKSAPVIIYKTLLFTLIRIWIYHYLHLIVQTLCTRIWLVWGEKTVLLISKYPHYSTF